MAFALEDSSTRDSVRASEDVGSALHSVLFAVFVATVSSQGWLVFTAKFFGAHVAAAARSRQGGGGVSWGHELTRYVPGHAVLSCMRCPARSSF